MGTHKYNTYLSSTHCSSRAPAAGASCSQAAANTRWRRFAPCPLGRGHLPSATRTFVHWWEFQENTSPQRTQQQKSIKADVDGHHRLIHDKQQPTTTTSPTATRARHKSGWVVQTDSIRPASSDTTCLHSQLVQLGVNFVGIFCGRERRPHHMDIVQVLGPLGTRRWQWPFLTLHACRIHSIQACMSHTTTTTISTSIHHHRRRLNQPASYQPKAESVRVCERTDSCNLTLRSHSVVRNMSIRGCPTRGSVSSFAAAGTRTASGMLLIRRT